MTADRLSVIFAALADPTRRGMLARLADGEATVTELAEPYAITMPAISRHLKVLERAGLISRSRSRQWRSSSLQAAPLKEAADWMDRYRQFWDASFDRLDAHLRRVMQDAVLAGQDGTAPPGSAPPGSAPHGSAPHGSAPHGSAPPGSSSSEGTTP